MGHASQLVRKHPEAKDLHPVRVQDVLSTLQPGSFDLVTALFDSASYLTPLPSSSCGGLLGA